MLSIRGEGKGKRTEGGWGIEGGWEREGGNKGGGWTPPIIETWLRPCSLLFLLFVLSVPTIIKLCPGGSTNPAHCS